MMPQPAPPPPEPPLANIEAEQALLAALLNRNGGYDALEGKLEPKHFLDGLNGAIFAAIGKLIEAGEKADATTVHRHVSAELAEPAVVRQYVTDLQANPLALHPEGLRSYAGVVRDLSERREMIQALEESLERVRNSEIYDTKATAEREALEDRLATIAADGDTGDGLVPIARGLDRWLTQVERARKNPGALVGIPSGLPSLDSVLGGWQAPDLVVIAARTGMFKTAVAIHYALAAAKAGHPVAFFSLEMGDEQLAGRLLAQEARVEYKRQRRGEISEAEVERLLDAERTIKALPLEVDQTPSLTIGAIRSRARRFRRKMGGKLGLVIVDYLQLMVGGKAENRVQEVAQITRGLKQIAMSLHCPVLALSQLNRALEAREDKRPMLSDLRESGSIEQDADIVLFNYYEHAYLRREEPKRKNNEDIGAYNTRLHEWQVKLETARTRIEISIGKNRHGGSRDVVVGIDPDTMRFSDPTTDDRAMEAPF